MIKLQKVQSKVSVKSVFDYLARDQPEIGVEDAMDYAARDDIGFERNDSVEGGTFNMEGVGISSPMDRDLIINMMDYISEAGRVKNNFNTNPIYHYSLNWPVGEKPTDEQIREAVEKTLKAVELHENQSFFVIHRDKEHLHAHVIANRVHPEKLTLSGPPRFDYLVLDKSCREIELSQGWQHTNGPHVVIDGQIKRLSEKQRKALGHEFGEVYSSTPAAKMMEKQSGMDSLSTWIKAEVKTDLLNTIETGKSWNDFHEKLADYGLKVEKSGGGLVFVANGLDDQTTSTKASGVDYKFSLGRLEKKLGPFAPANPADAKQAGPVITYKKHLEKIINGEIKGYENPGRTGKSEIRDQKRIEREASRKQLGEAYKTDKASAKDMGSEKRKALKETHAKQKQTLRQQLKTSRAVRMPILIQQYGSRQLASSIYAAEKVSQMQKLVATQKLEREQLNKDLDMKWPAWVERQAAAGNPAAISALRGIRYKQNQKINKSRAGFEGEDLSESLPEEQQAKEGKFKISSADISIDFKKLHVNYKDEDGRLKLVDKGSRIDVVDKTDKGSIEQGLLLAAQKFGGEVYITGDKAFREEAAKIATRMNIKIADPDLKKVVDKERSMRGIER